MGLPLPSNVVPIAAARSLRVVAPVVALRAAAPVAAGVAGGGLAGAAFGVALPLAAAFATGFEIGRQLLRLFNWLNQGQTVTEIPYTSLNPNSWPTAKPGQTITYFWAWWAVGYFESTPSDKGYVDNVTYTPTVGNVRPDVYYQGLGLCDLFDPNGGVARANVPYPGQLRLYSFNTSDGQPPQQPTVTSGSGVDRGPLVAAAGQPLSFVPPAEPAAPALPAGVPTRREEPKAPPLPGTPAPVPAVPGAVPGGAPGRQPGGVPVGPTVSPGQPIIPQRVGYPVIRPQPPTLPTRDPSRPPLQMPPPGTAPVPVPPAVPVTPADLIKYGELVVGDAAQRPRADLDSLAKELGRQEQKLAGLLGGLGYPEAFDRLLDLLSSIDTGTTYTLTPPCGTTPDGDPLPPVEVIVPPTIGDNAAVIARLDAIAMLLDEHKQMRQPICKGKATGQPVTVTALEVE